MITSRIKYNGIFTVKSALIFIITSGSKLKRYKFDFLTNMKLIKIKRRRKTISSLTSIIDLTK